jgi:hypothetical protein
MTEREILKLIHSLSRAPLFERTFRKAAQEALKALSEINKMTAPYA